MARVTVEDCIVQVPNRFELVLLAAQRARDISAGRQITLDRDRDKNPVVALREIAETSSSIRPCCKDSLISGMQKHADIDKPEEVNEMAELEQELAAALCPGRRRSSPAQGSAGGRGRRVESSRPRGTQGRRLPDATGCPANRRGVDAIEPPYSARPP